MRLFHGLIFFRYFGSLPPPADNRRILFEQEYAEMQ